MLLYKEESYAIIGACMEVHRVLGCGFLEVIYQEALAIEFEKRKIPFLREPELTVEYKGIILVKKFNADFICYEKIIVELKALSELLSVHQSQVINQLKVTQLRLGILVNFGQESLHFERLAN